MMCLDHTAFAPKYSSSMAAGEQRIPSLIAIFVLVLGRACLSSSSGGRAGGGGGKFVTAVGDPGMRRDELRVAIEAWNQCNEVGEEAPNMGSPRAADCFLLSKSPPHHSHGPAGKKNCSLWKLEHKVTEDDNKLGIGKMFPKLSPRALHNPDLYAYQKELYLGSKCQVEDAPRPWQFWMIMLKNGNMDTTAALCPNNGHRSRPFQDPNFPCFGKGCMNQPLIHHNFTALQDSCSTLKGSFYGTWDLKATASSPDAWKNENKSFYSVVWQKKRGGGSWTFHHVLKTSTKYPWLMLYLRADAAKGHSGGYHYPTRGMLKIIPRSPDFRVRFRLNVIKGGGPKSQFYLLDIGSCWKNNGKPCDGNVTTDVTRYCEVILNPETPSWCNPKDRTLCPPFHTFPNGTRVHRNDTARYPYGAYHVYCAPGNGEHTEKPNNPCDPYSNPQPQEIVQILPHPVWGHYGYPTKKGQGWIGDPTSWDLNVGHLSQNLYFYQDPGTKPVTREWTSIDLGTEIYKDPNQVAEWTVTDFDVLVRKGQ